MGRPSRLLDHSLKGTTISVIVDKANNNRHSDDDDWPLIQASLWTAIRLVRDTRWKREIDIQEDKFEFGYIHDPEGDDIADIPKNFFSVTPTYITKFWNTTGQ